METVEWRLRSECAIGERRSLLVMNDRRRTAGAELPARAGEQKQGYLFMRKNSLIHKNNGTPETIFSLSVLELRRYHDWQIRGGTDSKCVRGERSFSSSRVCERTILKDYFGI